MPKLLDETPSKDAIIQKPGAQSVKRTSSLGNSLGGLGGGIMGLKTKNNLAGTLRKKLFS